jgi:hypothetical protein
MLVVDMLVIAILFYMIDKGLTWQMSYIKDLGLGGRGRRMNSKVGIQTNKAKLDVY